MLDFFTIFTKGGIVLWCFQGIASGPRDYFQAFSPAVNALIKAVILQERGVASYEHERMMLKFCMDNEFELIFVVAYEKALKLAYMDKLLQQVQLEFRDRYKNELASGPYFKINFGDEFMRIYQSIENEHRLQSSQPRIMRPFSKDGGKPEQVAKARPEEKTNNDTVGVLVNGEGVTGEVNGEDVSGEGSPRNRGMLRPAMEMKGGMRKRTKRNPSGNKSSLLPKPSLLKPAKRVKENRKWDLGGTEKESEKLNYGPAEGEGVEGEEEEAEIVADYEMSEGLKVLKPLDVGDEEEVASSSAATTGKSGGGMFSFFKNLTGGKTITRESMETMLEHMKEHLITKNVAAVISEKLCESVATKLDGKVIGTFSGVQSTVRASMEESLVQILSPKRRIDVLRDVMDARESGRPYVITFCGVNGVGKSTNLAKIAFWLLENGLRVMIAACDTFRSGAVEQLRTHSRRLNHQHPPEREGGPPRLFLFERGYGKDAAGIAMEAIHSARQQHYDCVLVDTAGRMQDNEPLMKALAKLIRINSPDLVLFVGEALVGNEAVDQLVKFNRALVDHSDENNLHVIDGILLTKFDTIDDKVGAAISMTYITGQPIVFVGTGQTYTDLKMLNVHAVVSALLK